MNILRLHGRVVFLVFCLLSSNILAATVYDSSKLKKPTVVPANASTSCDYFASDTYYGTEAVGQEGQGNYLITNNNSLTLSWTNGSGSPLSTPVYCDGTYEVFFTLQLQATVNNNPVKVYLCVQATNPTTTIFGSCPASASTSYFTFNPQCNGGNYCATMTFPFVTTVQLKTNQMVKPPSISTNGQLSVSGGQFTVIYLSP